VSDLVPAQNRNGTAPGRPFLPGNRANPGGRPRGFGALIREQTGDGAELVTFALDVLRGHKRAPIRTRLQALAWLADRGWGSVTQSHEISGPGGAAVVFTLRLGERGELTEEDPSP
jgi:hypothetical protein